MTYYMVFWPQDRMQQIMKAKDEGPIKVVYGSIHSRMPTIASIKVGDIVFVVSLLKKKLYAMARLPVTHREPAFEYLIRETGNYRESLIPRDKVIEFRENFYWTGDSQSFRSAGAIPAKYQFVPQAEKPHLLHQEPFNCCSQWAVWGEDGSTIAPRPVPDELIPQLRFGYPKSKEKALRLDKNGNILPMSLTATRRLSEETAKIFESLF